jgi:hypothetical protein
MSKVIQVLANMASNASLINESNVTTMLIDAGITESQKMAIEAKDLDMLIEKMPDLSEIKCLPVIPAEDEEGNEEEEKENAESTIDLVINC